MPKQLFDFSHAEYQHFIEVCPFSDEELAVLDMRRRGKSIIEMASALNVADRTISRRIRSITRKISKEI